VHIVGRYEGKTFDERDLSFDLGEGAAFNICEGLEIALSKMKKGEVAEVDIKSKHAYGAAGKTEFSIPANADITYEVTMKNCERVSLMILKRWFK
jgi:FK506-binding protein 4/5